jgi:hypothetical protein
VKRQFVAYLFFVGWDCLSLGIHICFSIPNIEFHLPFCFVRIGWVKISHGDFILSSTEKFRKFGLKEKHFYK